MAAKRFHDAVLAYLDAPDATEAKRRRGLMIAAYAKMEDALEEIDLAPPQPFDAAIDPQDGWLIGG